MLIWAGKVKMVCINDEIEGYLWTLEVIIDKVRVCQELNSSLGVELKKQVREHWKTFRPSKCVVLQVVEKIRT